MCKCGGGGGGILSFPVVRFLLGREYRQPSCYYCTILIDSSVTHHGGYLTCRNIGCVTVSRRVLTKGQKMWQTSLWQFWSKFGHFVRKRVNLASAAAHRCMFHLKLSQKLLKYPASVWHLTKSGPCHTPKSQVTKWKFRQACHGVTWATNQSKLYSTSSILNNLWMPRGVS